MYAIIENNAVVGWQIDDRQPPLTVKDKNGDDGPNPTPQKDLRRLDIQWPDFDKATHQVGDPKDTLLADRVTRTWVVTPLAKLTVPDTVTNYQARAALLRAGLLPSVDAAVKSGGQMTEAYQAWEFANDVYRNSPLIATMAAALGLTSAQVDQLFITASTIA